MTLPTHNGLSESFAVRFLSGVTLWVLGSIATFSALDILSVDRLFVASFIGVLVVSSLCLPAEPTRRQLVAVALLVLVGLLVYSTLLLARIRAILG